MNMMVSSRSSSNLEHHPGKLQEYKSEILQIHAHDHLMRTGGAWSI